MILFYIKIDVILGVCCFIFILLNCFIIRVVSFIIYCEFISCLFNLNILLCMRGNSNLPPFDLYSLVRVVFFVFSNCTQYYFLSLARFFCIVELFNLRLFFALTKGSESEPSNYWATRV